MEWFELFLAANDIPDARKVPLFLTVLGGTKYGLLHNLRSRLAPDNPKDKFYRDIIAKLRAHLSQRP